MAERDLTRLLAGMAPRLHPGTFVFCALGAESVPAAASAAVLLFTEDEGMTAVVPAAEAESHGWAATYRCAWITLTVDSALDAVGFLATVTGALADAGISVNPVSAFHHDHLFVPEGEGARAVSVLKALSLEHRSGPG